MPDKTYKSQMHDLEKNIIKIKWNGFKVDNNDLSLFSKFNINSILKKIKVKYAFSPLPH